MPSPSKATVPQVSQRQVSISLATFALLLFFFWHQVLVPAAVLRLSESHTGASGAASNAKISDDEALDPQRHLTKDDLAMRVQTPEWDNGPLPMFYSISELEADQYRRHKMVRPSGVRKIVGLLFYSRRHTMSILDCYLMRNLVKNGGILDEVVFVVDTGALADVEFLDEMLAGESAYTRWDTDAHCDQGHACVYDMVKDDTMYISIDDGIVYIEDTTIPSIVHTKAAHPEYLSVSANIVNQPAMSATHWSLGAVKPYCIEAGIMNHDRNAGDSVTGKEHGWKTSALPVWEDEEADVSESDWNSHDLKRRTRSKGRGQADRTLHQEPTMVLPHTGPELSRKERASEFQQHYSLLENLEYGELGQYGFNMWHFRGESPGTQFVALMGRDIKAAFAVAEDLEQGLSKMMSQELGRRIVVDGHGLASYYSSAPQDTGIASTDVLERYRSFARQNICDGPMVLLPDERGDKYDRAAQAAEERQENGVGKKQLKARDIEKDTSDRRWGFLRMELDTS